MNFSLFVQRLSLFFQFFSLIYFVVYINNFHLMENIKYYMEKITMVDVTSKMRKITVYLIQGAEIMG